jgi:hypothetical protein
MMLCVVIVMAVILIVTGIGGPHGPGRNLSPAETGSQQTAQGVYNLV